MSEFDVEPEPIVEPLSPEPTTIDAAPHPVQSGDRVASIDVLRGVALLGILAMNSVHFAWPETVYDNPTAAPGYTWADLALWIVNQFLFNTKMMTIFSMLFGAGLVLMSDRASKRGRPIRAVYYRRIAVLLGIGIVHAYFIWDGDILVIYALCGLFLYPFRNLSARALIVCGVLLMCLIFPAWLVARRAVQYLDKTAAKKAAGEPMPPWRENLLSTREKLRPDEATQKKEFEKNIKIHRSTYAQIAEDRAEDLFFETHTFGFILFLWWYVGGRMLLGMGLMKLGVFAAARSRQFYAGLMAVGYGIGWPLVICDCAMNWYFDFFRADPLASMMGGWWIPQEVSGPLIAIGHVGLVMLIYREGFLPWLTRHLAAVGRMALTNYLVQSLVFTTIFYGYGLNYYGRFHRPTLMLMVVSMWAVQLLLSPVWLKYFRFGPAEWFWRTMTYGRPQPMLHESAAPVVDVPSVEQQVEG